MKIIHGDHVVRWEQKKHREDQILVKTITGQLAPWRARTVRREFRDHIGTRPRRIHGQVFPAHHPPGRNSEGNPGRGRVNLQQGMRSLPRVRKTKTTRKSQSRLLSCHTQDMRGRRSGVVHMSRLAPYSGTNQGTGRCRNPIGRLRAVRRMGPVRLTTRSRTHSERVMVCRRRGRRARSRTQTRERSR